MVSANIVLDPVRGIGYDGGMTNTNDAHDPDALETALRDFLASGNEDMMPRSANALDQHDRRIFLDARNALESGDCPNCGEGMDHGTWIPDMTSDYECPNGDFSITYPHPA